MALKVLCVSLLWYGYSLYLLKSWITSLIYFVQDRNKRGAGGTFHRIVERAQKSIQPSPIGRTDLPYIWNTHFLYAPNTCIWCTWEVSVKGRVDGRGIQCRLNCSAGQIMSREIFPMGVFPFLGLTYFEIYISKASQIPCSKPGSKNVSLKLKLFTSDTRNS